MKAPTPPRAARRAAILELVGRRAVGSQEELRRLLARRGLAADQATLSRDLRDLGLVKGPGGYALPAAGAPPADPTARLAQALRQHLAGGGARAAQNLVVLRTPPGGAQPLARALDEAREVMETLEDGRSRGAPPLRSVLGTLAGDDTILVITADAPAARRMARWLEDQA